MCQDQVIISFLTVRQKLLFEVIFGICMAET